MTEAPSPDVLKNLVFFIIGLAILGTIVALVIHFGYDLPMQQALHAPANAFPTAINSQITDSVS